MKPLKEHLLYASIKILIEKAKEQVVSSVNSTNLVTCYEIGRILAGKGFV